MDEKIERCPGSGEEQMLAWGKTDAPTEAFPKGYPGAAICNHCTYGVLVVRGTVVKAISRAGTKGFAGRMRVHYLLGRGDRMAYTKGELRRK